MMDLDVLAMERGECLDLLLQMNHLWDSFRLRFVQMIHYYFAAELPLLLPAVLAQVAVAVERIAEDCSCFHSHHHISAAAVVEDDIHRSTLLRRRELTMLKRSLRLP